MAGRVGHDRVAYRAGAALALPAPAGRRACLGELREQRVACLGEVGDAGDPGLGGMQQRGRGRGLDVAAVAGELGLDPADLAAQLAPPGALVDFEPGVVEVELQLGGQLGEVGLLALRLELRREPGLERLRQRRGDQGRDRDIAGVDACRVCRVDRLGGDPLDLGRALQRRRRRSCRGRGG